jgi:hypothetical protein
MYAGNATTEAQNALVTQTVRAMETEAARPTDEPTELPTEAPTDEAAQLPEIVGTPEVEQPATEEVEPVLPGLQQTATAEAEAAAATSVVGVDGGQATETPLPGGNTTPGTEPETLPETGLSIWSILAIGAVLIALLLVARRLRTT